MERQIFISEKNKRLEVRCLLVNCEPGNGTNYRYQMVIKLIRPILADVGIVPISNVNILQAHQHHGSDYYKGDI